MTVQKAWDIYDIEVKQKKEFYKKEMEKKSNIYLILGLALFSIGIILTLLGFAMPAHKGHFTTEGFLLKAFGIGLLLFSFICFGASISYNTKSKKELVGFMQENKRLYINCLSASDISEEDKLYYKQELEELRHRELLNEIRSAGADAAIAASTATMYNMINRK